MKISDMFPSEYIRGLEVSKPQVVTIKSVKTEQVFDFATNKKKEGYIVYFEELPKGVKLNITMAKAVAEALGDTEYDSANWIGGKITLYREKIKVKGKDTIVPRLRKVLSADKKAGQQTLANLTKIQFFGKVKTELEVSGIVAGWLVQQAGLVENGDYNSEKADEMWALIKADGPGLVTFIDEVMDGISFYEDTPTVLLDIAGQDVEYSEEAEQFIFDALSEVATKAAGELAEKEPVNNEAQPQAEEEGEQEEIAW